MSEYRFESDSKGQVKVDSRMYWGAQTERSLHHFSIGKEKMPIEVVHAFAILKNACAIANNKLGKLDDDIFNAIVNAAKEVYSGSLDEHFPLFVWQTGSGTQSNMNVNEVISNRAIELLGGEMGSKTPVHPNDHVNMSQSSNDTFPTAMHIATAIKLKLEVLPELVRFKEELESCQERFNNIVKIGRTHLQDAVPLTFGQMFSGYIKLINTDLLNLEKSLSQVLDLAIGGTAVGTGLNAHKDFSKIVCEEISKITDLDFKSAPNKFSELSAHQGMLAISASCNALAASMNKIANDIRWLGSGPRCGIGELILPANEPGSSIMPGKVNPTQCEAMTMACIQIMSNHTAVSNACSLGNFELNVYKPLIAYNVIQQLNLLKDSSRSFYLYCLKGLEVNKVNTQYYVDNSLMLVTALNPVIGYDKASEIAQKASLEGTTLKQACLSLGYLTEDEFNKHVCAKSMTNQ